MKALYVHTYGYIKLINLDEKMVFLSIEFIHSFQKSTVITYSILPSVTFYPLLAESLVG